MNLFEIEQFKHERAVQICHYIDQAYNNFVEDFTDKGFFCTYSFLYCAEDVLDSVQITPKEALIELS